MTDARRESARAGAPVVVGLLLAGAVTGLAGTDLILPAAPAFPALFDSTPETAQYVVVAYVAGFAAGLIVFGRASEALGRARLLLAAAAGFAAASALLAVLADPPAIIAARALQGACAAAPAVFAPAVVKALFDEARATRVLGALASVESLAPAFAPIVGLWLFSVGGWALPFIVLAVIGGALLLALTAVRGAIPEPAPAPDGRAMGYVDLLRRPVFLRYGFSQAACLGGLIMFVLSAPMAIVNGLSGTPRDFVIMQIIGIAGFILAANAAGVLSRRVGPEPLIVWGTLVSLAASAALLAYALAGGERIGVLFALFAPFNIGLGLRGPPGFLRAIMASGGGDDRASSLVILAAAGIAAGGAGLIAPYIESGITPAAFASTVILAMAALSLALAPPLGTARD
ncbi:MAG: MFS transporter [Caulobacterales bacterium]|nr:MFS transporter [Caulobacterales bacterium]